MSVLSAILLFGFLIFIHELGHFIFAKISGVKVLKFSLGFGPKIIGKKIGETEYLISAVPLGGYVKMLGQEDVGEVQDESDSAERENSFRYKSAFKRASIIFAGPIFNILLTFVIYTAVLSIGFSVPIPDLKNLLPTLDAVEDGYPAAKAGLQKGDTIVRINSHEIITWIDVINVVSMNPGENLSFVVKRDAKLLNFSITPVPVEEKDIKGDKIIIGRIGVRKAGAGIFTPIKSDSIFDAPIKGLIATYKMGFFIFDSIHMMISGNVSAKNISGPITIVAESSKAAAAGILPYFMFMAILSVNLGILNLLPIPILDGGHLLFLGIEVIRKKPLSEKAVMIAQRIGLAVIISLTIFAFYNDILRLIGGKPIP